MSKDIDGLGQPQSGMNFYTGAQANGPATGSPGLNNVVTDNEHEGLASDAVGSTEDDQQWDEAAVVPRVKSAPASSAPEVLDMKSFAQNKGSENISEKLRVEATKAQLAAAREGMEREASRAKAEKERKEQEAKEKEAAKAAPSGGGGGIWVSARLRAAQSANLPKMRMGGGGSKQQQLDTSNEELFPDLASADKILEQKEKGVPAGRIPKKTPVGGGASWATKAPSQAPAISSTKSVKKADQQPSESDETATAPIKTFETKNPSPDVFAESEAIVAPEGVQEREEMQEKPNESAPVETLEEINAADAVPNVKPKKSGKKKKKDVSDFKPGAQ